MDGANVDLSCGTSRPKKVLSPGGMVAHEKDEIRNRQDSHVVRCILVKESRVGRVMRDNLDVGFTQTSSSLVTHWLTMIMTTTLAKYGGHQQGQINMEMNFILHGDLLAS